MTSNAKHFFSVTDFHSLSYRYPVSASTFRSLRTSDSDFHLTSHSYGRAPHFLNLKSRPSTSPLTSSSQYCNMTKPTALAWTKYYTKYGTYILPAHDLLEKPVMLLCSSTSHLARNPLTKTYLPTYRLYQNQESRSLDTHGCLPSVYLWDVCDDKR